ncbi:unnamed protein product, partial [Rotaria socialis]
ENKLLSSDVIEVIGIIIEFAGGVRDCSHVTPSLYVGGI